MNTLVIVSREHSKIWKPRFYQPSRGSTNRLDRLERLVEGLEADLCTHSIATRKADDDLAARVGRLESAHQATVPVDAMRRLIEWAYLHQLSSSRKWDRLQDTINEVLAWSPEIGVFTFSSNGGFFWQDYAPKEVE